MAAPPRLTAEQKERIYQLKEKGKSGRAVAELCANGFEDLPPFKVSGQRCNDVWRTIAKERDELYGRHLKKLPLDEPVPILARRMIDIAEREVDRLDRAQRRGRMNGNQLTALAASLRRLQALAREATEDDAGTAQKGAEGVSAALEAQESDDWMAGMLSDEEPPPVAEVADVPVVKP